MRLAVTLPHACMCAGMLTYLFALSCCSDCSFHHPVPRFLQPIGGNAPPSYGMPNSMGPPNPYGQPPVRFGM